MGENVLIFSEQKKCRNAKQKQQIANTTNPMLNDIDTGRKEK